MALRCVGAAGVFEMRGARPGLEKRGEEER
jgi:hypothetical protein